MPKEVNLHVRGVSLELWRRLREYAVRIGEPVGHVLNQAIAEFLANRAKK